MVHPPGSFDLAMVIRSPTLVVQENVAFIKECPKTEASIQVLLRWRVNIEDERKFWLKNYLGLFKAYIHPSVDLDNIEDLELCTADMEKSS